MMCTFYSLNFCTFERPIEIFKRSTSLKFNNCQLLQLISRLNPYLCVGGAVTWKSMSKSVMFLWRWHQRNLWQDVWHNLVMETDAFIKLYICSHGKLNVRREAYRINPKIWTKSRHNWNSQFGSVCVERNWYLFNDSIRPLFATSQRIMKLISKTYFLQ